MKGEYVEVGHFIAGKWRWETIKKEYLTPWLLLNRVIKYVV